MFGINQTRQITANSTVQNGRCHEGMHMLCVWLANKIYYLSSYMNSAKADNDK